MIFRLFKKKGERDVENLVESLRLNSEMQKQLAKAQSLKQLGRRQEAFALLGVLERVTRDLIRRNPAAADVHFFLASVYEEMDATDRLVQVLEGLLTSTNVDLSERERLIAEFNLRRVQRERAPTPAIQQTKVQRLVAAAKMLSTRQAQALEDNADSSDRANRAGSPSPENFTTVYCCPNCGRLRNACTVPCPHCSWAPQSVDDIARCWMLSTESFKVPGLLSFARQIRKHGPTSVEAALPAHMRRGLVTAAMKVEFEQLLELLRRHEELNRRDIGGVCFCPDCDTRIAFAAADECRNCGNNDLNIPVPERAIFCIDNLLIAIEEGLTSLDSDAFSEFVCVLVRIQHQLVFHQKPPSDQHRRYALELLASVGRLVVGKNAAIVSVKDPANITCSVVDHADEKIAVASVGLLMELRYFSSLMRFGVRD